MGSAGIMIELHNSITAIILVQQFITDSRFQILIKGIKLVDGHTHNIYTTILWLTLSVTASKVKMNRVHRVCNPHEACMST